MVGIRHDALVPIRDIRVGVPGRITRGEGMGRYVRVIDAKTQAAA